MLFMQLPALNFTAPEPIEQTTLQVELVTQQPTLAPSVALPEPDTINPPAPVKQPDPEPVPVVHKPAPAPVPSPPRPVTKPPEPALAEPSPEAHETTEATSPTTVQEVMTAPPGDEPTPSAQPAPAAPPVHEPALPPQPAGPSQQDIEAARNLYGSLLSQAIAKHKQYPRIAQMRGWEGEVLLEVHCDETGHVLSTHVKKSSGHQVLDEQAITMVRKASPLPQPPEILRNTKNLVILVPIPFTLESS
ncbi:energy transducer TonB [Methylobacillus flagellatus]|uniref:Outer membrane transport energization protein TonB n=1 Tax=Methylobacillus flagellatus (strain ATCC 51484 / DSM 6875 / VKM B-1610 / KT) TaxID=265072 RepID=Q1GYW4_METFK|nr:energy transducer TonB [Methylobacillus flagellatus]ABE50573.1 outer membrane transport energization protein TonB [Methylobacillus flagellatus KT]